MRTKVCRHRLRIGVALAAFGASVAHAQGGCFVTCMDDGCKLAVTLPYPIDKTPRLVPACASQKVTSGRVLALFRSEGKAGKALIKAPESFQDRLASFRVIDCLSGEGAACRQPGMATVKLGKGFDPAAPWELTGDPCALGFPCGKIGLPAAGLRIRLADLTLQGRLRVFPARGQEGDHVSNVANGVIDLPAATLNAGQTYRYQYIGPDGKVGAAGEFATLSQRAQRDSDAQLADATKQPLESRSQAVLESLLLDGREWEALQVSFEGKK